MKSLVTLFGWIAIGAVITFAGQQVWKHFRQERPERSREIANKVTETLNKGAKTIKKTAGIVAEKTEPKPTEPTPTVATPEKSAAPVEADETVVETPSTDVKEIPSEEIKEDKITERFYKLAEDNAEVKQPKTPATTETATEYERRQDRIARQEDILMQRQMRIVNELTGE